MLFGQRLMQVETVDFFWFDNSLQAWNFRAGVCSGLWPFDGFCLLQVQSFFWFGTGYGLIKFGV